MKQDNISNTILKIINADYELLGFIDVDTDHFELVQNARKEWNFEPFHRYRDVFSHVKNLIPTEAQQDKFNSLFSLEVLRDIVEKKAEVPRTLEVQFCQYNKTEWFSITRYDTPDFFDSKSIILFTVSLITSSKAKELEYKAMYTALKNNYSYILSVMAETNSCRLLYNSMENDAFSSSCSYTEFIDKITELTYEEDIEVFYNTICLENIVDKLLSQNSIETLVRFKLKEEYHWNEVTITRFYDERLDELRFLFLIRDVDEQKKIENKHYQELQWALEKAEKSNLSHAEFINNVSHEIRTPLNGIKAIAELMLQKDALNIDTLKQYSRIIVDSSNGLMKIINSLLDFSNLSTDVFPFIEESYETKDLLTDIQKFIELRKNKNVKYTIHCDEMLPRSLYGDMQHIVQSVSNIIDNAFKFTHSGNILMEVMWGVIDQNEGNLHFTIRDTGIGIKEENFENIFKVFWQVQNKTHMESNGIGIGLTLSKMILEQMGGTINFTSIYGVGTEFQINIPQTVLDGQPFGSILENETDLYDVQELYLENRHILVVDDSPMNLEVMQIILEELGAQVTTCSSGIEAILLLKDNSHYDIIFMDHFMPNMDGVEAVAQIREIDSEYCKTVPIVAFTANAVPNANKYYQEVGMNDLLLKPIDIKKLKVILSKWLSKK